MTDQKLFSLNDILKIIRWAEDDAADEKLEHAFWLCRCWARKYYCSKLHGIEAQEELKELAAE